MSELGLDSLIIQVNSDYNPYGETIITKSQWIKLYEMAEAIDG